MKTYKGTKEPRSKEVIWLKPSDDGSYYIEQVWGPNGWEFVGGGGSGPGGITQEKDPVAMPEIALVKAALAELQNQFGNLTIPDAMTWEDSVANFAALPTDLTTTDDGKTYQTLDDGKIYLWNGTKWITLTGLTDLSNYYNRQQTSDLIDTKVAASLADYDTSEEVDDKIAAAIEALSETTEEEIEDVLDRLRNNDADSVGSLLSTQYGAATNITITQEQVNDGVYREGQMIWDSVGTGGIIEDISGTTMIVRTTVTNPDEKAKCLESLTTVVGGKTQLVTTDFEPSDNLRIGMVAWDANGSIGYISATGANFAIEVTTMTVGVPKGESGYKMIMREDMREADGSGSINYVFKGNTEDKVFMIWNDGETINTFSGFYLGSSSDNDATSYLLDITDQIKESGSEVFFAVNWNTTDYPSGRPLTNDTIWKENIRPWNISGGAVETPFVAMPDYLDYSLLYSNDNPESLGEGVIYNELIENTGFIIVKAGFAEDPTSPSGNACVFGVEINGNMVYQLGFQLLEGEDTIIHVSSGVIPVFAGARINISIAGKAVGQTFEVYYLPVKSEGSGLPIVPVTTLPDLTQKRVLYSRYNPAPNLIIESFYETGTIEQDGYLYGTFQSLGISMDSDSDNNWYKLEVNGEIMASDYVDDFAATTGNFSLTPITVTDNHVPGASNTGMISVKAGDVYQWYGVEAGYGVSDQHVVEGIDFDKFFWRAEHHWNSEAGFWASGKAFEALNAHYDAGFDPFAHDL